jgi:hypothetical protein
MEDIVSNDSSQGAIARVLEAQQTELECSLVCEPDSPLLAHELLKLAQDVRLPVAYRRRLALRVHSIYQDAVPARHPNQLSVLKVLAHTAPEAERLEAFRRVVDLQDVIADGDRERASAFANLAAALEKVGRYGWAVYCYRRSQALIGDDYVKSKLAHCLASLGQFEDAYKLMIGFANTYLDQRATSGLEPVDALLLEAPAK